MSPYMKYLPGLVEKKNGAENIKSCRKHKVVPKIKSRAENIKQCRKNKVVPKTESRAENKKWCRKHKVVPKKKSRAKKKIALEKTDVVKKKFDDKNQVALTGLRTTCLKNVPPKQEFT